MVIEISTAFAMRCPICGRLETHQINIFQLSGKKIHQIECSCGYKKASLRRKGNHIQVDYFCVICDEMHSKTASNNLFWTKNHLNFLSCLETELNLGYYGSYKLLKEEIDRQKAELDSIADELGFDDFEDPELMLEALDYLHDIAADGKLDCDCGSHNINIELYSDTVELICNHCRTRLSIPAATEENIKLLKNKDLVRIKYIQGSKKSSLDPWINI